MILNDKESEFIIYLDSVIKKINKINDKYAKGAKYQDHKEKH
jgi:hypothetical protein